MVIISINKNAAVVAPVCGMVGTIVGLIQVLKNMSDPSQLGPSMALGLIATFWGGFFSGLVFTPIASKLKIMSDEEAGMRRLITEGVIMIEKNEIPLKVEKYLQSFQSFSKSSKGKAKGK